MPDSPVNPEFPAELRAMAESLLRQGMATASEGHYCSADALSVLYKMACSHDSAADSLKMLHELQTLQIELDLQREQNAASAIEAAAELQRYKALFDNAPVGYVVINREGCIEESNQAAAVLLGSTIGELDGELIEDFLAPASRPLFNWQLKKMFKGSSGETSYLYAKDNIDAGLLRVVATLAPDGDEVLMSISKQECRPAI
jgi:PAS domain S-box-containing protein